MATADKTAKRRTHHHAGNDMVGMEAQNHSHLGGTVNLESPAKARKMERDQAFGGIGLTFGDSIIRCARRSPRDRRDGIKVDRQSCIISLVPHRCTLSSCHN